MIHNIGKVTNIGSSKDLFFGLCMLRLQMLFLVFHLKLLFPNKKCTSSKGS